MSVEVCSPVTRLAAERPFNRKTSQQTEQIAMRIVNQDLNRIRQRNLLPFSVNLRCYPGNFGSGDGIGRSGSKILMRRRGHGFEV